MFPMENLPISPISACTIKDTKNISNIFLFPPNVRYQAYIQCDIVKNLLRVNWATNHPLD